MWMDAVVSKYRCFTCGERLMREREILTSLHNKRPRYPRVFSGQDKWFYNIRYTISQLRKRSQHSKRTARRRRKREKKEKGETPRIGFDIAARPTAANRSEIKSDLRSPAVSCGRSKCKRINYPTRRLRRSAYNAERKRPNDRNAAMIDGSTRSFIVARTPDLLSTSVVAVSSHPRSIWPLTCAF